MKHIKKYIVLIPMLAGFGYANAMDSCAGAGAGASEDKFAREERFVNPFEQQILNEKLLLAVRQSDIAEITKLLEAGADVDSKDRDGFTALMLVNNIDVAKILIDAVPDPRIEILTKKLESSEFKKRMTQKLHLKAHELARDHEIKKIIRGLL